MHSTQRDPVCPAGIRRALYILSLALLAMGIAACNPTRPGAETAEAAFAVTPYVAESVNEAPTVTEIEPQTVASAEQTSDSNPAQTGTDSGATVLPAPGLRQYNGEIVPVDRVAVIAEANGMALDVTIDVGDIVRAGEILAVLDSAAAEAQRAQALAGLEAAQAQLDLLVEDVDDEDLEAVRAAVSAADAAYKRALEGPTPEDERLALAQLRQAEAAVTVAQSAFNRVKGNPQIAALPESLQLQQATLQVEAARAQYDKILIGATDDVIAGAYAQLAQARATLINLEEGAKPAQIRAAQAQVKQAETALYLAQLQVDKTVISAPVDGIVSAVGISRGGMVAPGAAVAVLISESTEVTIQVEENRLAALAIGQRALFSVDAYADLFFQGEIIRISPELDPISRTVMVTIQPDDPEKLLAPGMFTTVDLLE